MAASCNSCAWVIASLVRAISPWFRLKKRLGVLLHALFPQIYLPLYTMIEFTRIPYAEAVQRARRQNRVVASIAALAGIAILAACLILRTG